MLQPATDKPLVEIICDRLTTYIYEKKLSNADMVQIIEYVGGFLNLQTRSDYCRQTGLSYNGAKKHRQNVELFGTKFIIDNL